jgi:triosephosphate isomerase
MRRKLVIGNWKMHGSLASVDQLIAGLKDTLGDAEQPAMALCPSYVFIARVAEQLQGSAISCGAQNLSDQAQGAFTGEVSGSMLSELGCSYVLVGHSERRGLYGETDALVAGKFIAALAAKLTPVLCVGESLEQRQQQQTLSVIERQVLAVIERAGVQALATAVIAYEPIWAIGTGQTATSAQAQAVHAHIRAVVAAQGASIADRLQILYGGSVKADNAVELFSQADIDGALVGGASLQAADFSAICQAAV